MFLSILCMLFFPPSPGVQGVFSFYIAIVLPVARGTGLYVHNCFICSSYVLPVARGTGCRLDNIHIFSPSPGEQSVHRYIADMFVFWFESLLPARRALVRVGINHAHRPGSAKAESLLPGGALVTV